MTEKEFYKAGDLAGLLEVHSMIIYRCIRTGRLRAYKIDREFRIGKAEFNVFLEKVSTK